MSKGELYDLQTEEIIKKVCSRKSNCVDVGAYRGDILDIMLKYAPEGKHYAFEPIPGLYEFLREKYGKNRDCRIFDEALSDQKGNASFNYVITNPAYSGLIKRKYDREEEKDTSIEVKTDLLDNILPADHKVDLVKIDVEGGELPVLKGALNTIKKHRPVIVFEHGTGASEFYGTTPGMLYELLESCGLKLYTLSGWLSHDAALTIEEHEHLFNTNEEYYFVAAVNS